MSKLLETKQHLIYERMADNFDTPSVVHHLSEVVTATNSYVSQDKSKVKIPLVRNVSKYVLFILKCFGVYDEDVFP